MNKSELLSIIGEKKLPPERIYGWLDSQLSLARHYGGCTYQGYDYVIDPIRPDPPLVRVDVLAREAKEAKLKKKEKRDAEKMDVKQTDLL